MFTLARMIVPPLLAIVFAMMMHFGVASFDNGYWINQLTVIGIAIILAVSLNIVNGFTGQFSIGHAGFLSIGGYMAGAILYYGSIRWFNTRDSMAGVLSFTQPLAKFNFETAHWFTQGDAFFLGVCIACGLSAGLIGLLVGLPSLRLRGDYLAIVTVGFGEIVRILIESSNPQIKNASSFKRVSKAVHEAGFGDLATGLGQAIGFNFIPKYGSLFWVYLFVGVTILAALRLKYSTHGRAYLSIREDEIAAEAMGVRSTRYKVQAFVIAAFFAGIAGALTASSQGTINASELAFMKSLEIVVIIVLGGLGSISGAVIAAIVLTFLPELLQNETFAKYRLILYSLILILVMILRPRGLLGTQELWTLWRRKRAAT
jgi:branched-chain amino acid transport system permease protein